MRIANTNMRYPIWGVVKLSNGTGTKRLQDSQQAVYLYREGGINTCGRRIVRSYWIDTPKIKTITGRNEYCCDGPLLLIQANNK